MYIKVSIMRSAIALSIIVMFAMTLLIGCRDGLDKEPATVVHTQSACYAKGWWIADSTQDSVTFMKLEGGSWKYKASMPLRHQKVIGFASGEKGVEIVLQGPVAVIVYGLRKGRLQPLTGLLDPSADNPGPE